MHSERLPLEKKKQSEASVSGIFVYNKGRDFYKKFSWQDLSKPIVIIKFLYVKNRKRRKDETGINVQIVP